MIYMINEIGDARNSHSSLMKRPNTFSMAAKSLSK